MVAQGPGLRAILLAGLMREGPLEMRRNQRAERRKEGTWVGNLTKTLSFKGLFGAYEVCSHV